LIATRHNLHAQMTLQALRAGKNVFVEMPLALTQEELAQIEAFYEGRDEPLLMTGFNRRFSPAAVRAKEVISGRTTALIADYRMNAGFIPPDHWVHGPEGGG
jgi:predicted dehydrogenase